MKPPSTRSSVSAVLVASLISWPIWVTKTLSDHTVLLSQIRCKVVPEACVAVPKSVAVPGPSGVPMIAPSDDPVQDWGDEETEVVSNPRKGPR